MYELLATQYLEMCDPSRHEQKHKAQPTFLLRDILHDHHDNHLLLDVLHDHLVTHLLLDVLHDHLIKHLLLPILDVLHEL